MNFLKNVTLFPNEKNKVLIPGIVKFGIDPTSDKLHIGHMVPMRILKELRSIGHEICIVLGTHTAQLGDPSGRDKMRPILSRDDVLSNAERLVPQIVKIIGKEFILESNHSWFEKRSIADFNRILSSFTVSGLMARDSFKKRNEDGASIGIHELIVPILQGIDSVEVRANIEVGGSDQLFNFQVSRKIQEIEGMNQQTCILLPIINGTDGRKMSKTLNNCIFLEEKKDDIFGKVMSISDVTMEEWIPLFSDNNEITEIHPMSRKKKLAWTIVKQICGEDDANSSLNNFESLVQRKEILSEVEQVDIDIVDNKRLLINAVKKIRNCSNSESRRLISGGSVKINNRENTSFDPNLEIFSGDVVFVGKRDFRKIK